MGDLNGPEDSPEVAELLGDDESGGSKLIDSYRKLYPQRSPDESTFGGWKGTNGWLANRFHFAHRRVQADRGRDRAHQL